MGQIRLREVQFQTPSSVSFLRLTEFQGASSVSSPQSIVCVPKRTHRVFLQNSPKFAAELSEFSPPKQYSRSSIPPVSYLVAPYCVLPLDYLSDAHMSRGYGVLGVSGCDTPPASMQSREVSKRRLRNTT